MADKIDSLTLPNSGGTTTTYDIDLPADASPSIASLTASGTITGGSIKKSGGTSSQFLKADGSVDSTAYTTNTGTVTSVRVQAGTGLSSSTSTAQSATLDTTISIASGYKLPTTTEWESISSQGGIANVTVTGTGNAVTTGSYDSSTKIVTLTKGSTFALSSDLSGYQPKDDDLTAIAGLTGTSGLLKKTAANTWELDTNTYLTSESDTLATVTGRGATTSTQSTFSSGIKVGYDSSANNDKGIILQGDSSSKQGRIGLNSGGDIGIYGYGGLYLRPGNTTPGTSSSYGLKMTNTDFSPTTNESMSLGTSSYQYNDIRGKTLYENGTSLASKYQAKLGNASASGKVLKSTNTSGGVEWADDNNDNTWRTIQVNNADILGSGTSTGKLNLIAGTNVTITNSGGNVTIQAIGGDTDLVEEITYSSLISKLDGTLVPGMKYRITDYCTTVNNSDSEVGCKNHAFDLIVTATSESSISEDAEVVLHSGDTYFQNCQLDMWEVKYSPWNDTSLFEWADSTNGKGVIYYMRDEFGNEAPYDFKNITFSYIVTDISATALDWYTFSCYDANGNIIDASLVSSTNCINNKMKEYIDASGSTAGQRKLNKNLFLPFNTSQTTGSFFGNSFDTSCRQNVLFNGCQNNRFGPFCSQNILNRSCSRNIFANTNISNRLGNSCSNNTLGIASNNNVFGSSCARITLGNACNNSTFGTNNSDIVFLNNVTRITTPNYTRTLKIDSYCTYIDITSSDTTASSSNQLQNVHIHSNIRGSSSTHTSIVVPDRALPYELDYYLDENSNVISLINNNTEIVDLTQINE